MAQDNSNALMWVLGGALALIALFVVILLVSVNSQADSVLTSTSVTNVAPTVDTLVLKDNGATVAASGNVTLNSGTTETVTLTGTVSDDNGVGTTLANGNLAEIEGMLYLTGTTCASTGNRDNNNCYYSSVTDTSCTLGAQVDTTTINYTCTFSVNYWADGSVTGTAAPTGTWTAKVIVTDDSSSAANSTQLFEIPALLALSIPSTINYGTLTREESTTNTTNQVMTITQYGNDGADVEVSGTTMPCTVVGTISIGAQSWALTDVSASTVGDTDLTGAAVDTNLAVGYRTSESTAVTESLYWNIVMPNVASGTCSGTNTITAIAS